MGTQESLQNAFEIAQLKESTMVAIARDKNTLQQALIFVVAAVVLGALGMYFFPVHMYGGMLTYRLDAAEVFSRMVVSSFVSIGWLYLNGYLAEKLFHSQLSMQGFVQVMGYASVLGFLALFPPLRFVAALWYFVVFCFTLSRLGKLSVGSIVLLVLLEGFAGFVLMMVGMF